MWGIISGGTKGSLGWQCPLLGMERTQERRQSPTSSQRSLVISWYSCPSTSQPNHKNELEMVHKAGRGKSTLATILPS
jgi:hypothetical protein